MKIRMIAEIVEAAKVSPGRRDRLRKLNRGRAIVEAEGERRRMDRQVETRTGNPDIAART